MEIIAKSRLFDPKWYAAQHRDVTSSGVSPAEHYLWVGAALGRDPGPLFSTSGYLASRP